MDDLYESDPTIRFESALVVLDTIYKKYPTFSSEALTERGIARDYFLNAEPDKRTTWSLAATKGFAKRAELDEELLITMLMLASG